MCLLPWFCDLSLPFLLCDTFFFSSDAVSRVTPREFEESYIRVFCRYSSQQDTVKEIFQQVSDVRCSNIAAE